MKYVLSFLFLLVSFPSLAESIPTHWAKMNSGSYVVYKGSQTGSYVSVYRGKSNGFHIVDQIPGTDPNGPRSNRTYRGDVGNVVREVLSDGDVIQYTPHNCQRVVGICRYKLTDAGVVHNFEHELNRTSHGFTYQVRYIYDDGTKKIVNNGAVQKLDEFGTTIRQKDAPPGFTADKLRAVQIVYR